MKWISNACGRHRQDISLLASGALPEAERRALESHLAVCAACQKYFVEMKDLCAPLAGWGGNLAHVEPSEAIRVRWAMAIQRASQPKQHDLLSTKSVLLAFWHELIWPSCRIWAGLAAAWLFILVANLHLQTGGPRRVATDSPVPADFMMTLHEQQQMMAELIGRSESKAAVPPKPFAPQPRSEARIQLET